MGTTLWEAAVVVPGAIAFVLIRRKSTSRVILLIPLMACLLSATFHIKDVYRLRIMGEAAGNAAAKPHELHFLHLPENPSELWKKLEDAESSRIAVVAGWCLSGHNWFVYPLLGSRLQNRWFYIAPTCSGKPYDTAPGSAGKRETCLSYEKWLTRLMAHEIDVVCVLAKPTIENEWMKAHPESFRLIAQSKPNALNQLYKILPKRRSPR
jgi:hypothetical protein